MAWTSTWKKKYYIPHQTEPFKLSRSKIDMFIECPRCFYLDRRLEVAKPSMAPFLLNTAVDHLLKKEFDVHRKEATPHPIISDNGLDLIPFNHPKIDEWRENFVGVQYLHEESNFLVFGAVDDLWVEAEKDGDASEGADGGAKGADAGAKGAAKGGKVHVVDYKATSKDEAVKELEDTRWHDQYRRQMEIYQWLLRHNDVNISDTGYFVYVNGRKDLASFDGKLEFEINLISYKGNSDWVDEVLVHAKKCLDSDEIPAAGGNCEYCKYREQAGMAFKKHVTQFGAEVAKEEKAGSKSGKDASSNAGKPSGISGRKIAKK
jgi:hypothetical protein